MTQETDWFEGVSLETLGTPQEQGMDLGYASSVNPDSILKNPEFLRDLQDRYDPTGNLSDDQLISMFYSDENWAQLNTVSAGKRFFEGGGDTGEEKTRNARLATVWDNLPFFWQEGGRGWGATGDIAGAVIADPINLIGGLAAKGVAQTAARTATALGKPAPIRSTLKGMTAAAATEGTISGGQEALINVSEQSYRQDIGLQDEFDMKQFAAATGFGVALGTGIGGAIGIPGAVSGTRLGGDQAQALTRGDLTPEEIAGLSNKRAGQEVDFLDQKDAGLILPAPKSETETATPTEGEDATEVPKTSTEKILEELGSRDANGILQTRLETARDALAEAEEANINITDPQEKAEHGKLIKDLKEEVRVANLNIGVVTRLQGEADQIKKDLNYQNDPGIQAKAEKAQALLDNDVAIARAAIRAGDGDTIADLIAKSKERVEANAKAKADAQEPQAKTEGKGAATNKTAATTTADDVTVSSQEDTSAVTTDVVTETVDESPAAEAGVVADEAVDADALPPTNWGNKEGAKTSTFAELEKAGITGKDAEDFIKVNIANGKIGLNNKGVVQQKLPARIREILAEQEQPDAQRKVDPEPTAEEVQDAEEVFEREVADASSANQRVTDPEEFKKIVLAQVMRNMTVAEKNALARTKTPKQDTKPLEGGGGLLDGDDPDLLSSKFDEVLAKAQAQELNDARLVKDIPFRTTTERKRHRDLFNSLKSDESKLSIEDADLIAKARVLKDRGVKKDNAIPRGSQAAIDRISVRVDGEDVSLFPTAGRTTNNRIQSFIKSQSPRVGLNPNEQANVGNRMFDVDSAMSESREIQNRKKTLLTSLLNSRKRARNETKIADIDAQIKEIEDESDVVQFISLKTTRNVISVDYAGQIDNRNVFKAGEPLAARADEKGGKIYDSVYSANYRTSGLRKELESKDGKVVATPPLKKGNARLIVRHKEKGYIRLTNNTQAESGYGLQSLLGTQDPNLWESRYILESELPNKMPKKGLEKDRIHAELFEKAQPIEGAEGRGVIRVNGDAAGGYALPIEMEHIEKIPLALNKLSDMQKKALERRQDAFNGKDAKGIYLWHVVDAINKLESRTPIQNKTEFAVMSSDLEQLYAIQRDQLPGGFIRPDADRASAVSALDEVLTDVDPEQVVAIKRMIKLIVGDPNKAPRIKQGSGDSWSYDGTSIMAGRNKSLFNLELSPSFIGPRQEGINPDQKFFHAVAQWSYDNILTPEDRMVFWNALTKDMVADKNVLNGIENYSMNEGGVPRKIYADQFAAWVYQKRAVGLFGEENKDYWQKNSTYMSDIIKRYFNEESISPVNEALFSKMLPTEIRLAREIDPNYKDGSLVPKSKQGVYTKGLKAKLKSTRENYESALREHHAASGNPDKVIMAGMKARDMLGHVLKSRIYVEGASGGTLSWLRELDKIARTRFADLNFILSDKGLSEDFAILKSEIEKDKRIKTSEGLDQIINITDIEVKANALGILYDDGYAAKQGTSPTLVEADYDADGNVITNRVDDNGNPIVLGGPPRETWGADQVREYTGNNARQYLGDAMDQTSLRWLFRELERRTDEKHFHVEGQALTNWFDMETGQNIKKDTTIKPRKSALKQAEDNEKFKNKALHTTKTRQKDRAKKKAKYDQEQFNISQKDKSKDDLIAEYKEKADTPEGDQIAFTLMERVQNDFNYDEFMAYQTRKRTKEEKSALNALSKQDKVSGENTLLSAYKEAARTGEWTAPNGKKYKLSSIEYEVHRRLGVDFAKKNKPSIPSILRQRIKTEVDQNAGIATEDGIPPSAPIGIKTLLSYMSHRDSKVQYTQRTLLYRMMNMMGKNVQDVMGETNVMDASDIAELVGVPQEGLKNVAIDFRGEHFNKLRKNMRRMSIGLTKGNSNPFDAIHEIGHTIIRAGMLPKEELAAVHELYGLADDAIKKRVEKDYSNKYKEMNDVQKELRLAEEWFAESLASFLGEKTMRGDISKALDGDFSNVRLKNSFERAIDRIIDYISYITNGLMGRKDIRQQFRRLMIHGDMFETTGKTPFDQVRNRRNGSKVTDVSPEYAAYLGHDSIRYSKPSKKQAMKKFTAGGKHSENADGSPVIYFHGTPNGRAFENSQVVMQPSTDGYYGPGIYISTHSRVASKVYAQTATPQSQMNILDSLDLSEAEYRETADEIKLLSDVRRAIAAKRRNLANAEEAVRSHNDEVLFLNSSGALEDADFAYLKGELKTKEAEEIEIRNDLKQYLLEENNLASDLSDKGIGNTSTVLPLVTRMLNTFDFSRGVVHRPFSPEAQAIMEAISDISDVPREKFDKSIADGISFPENGLRGKDVYDFYVDTIVASYDYITRNQAKEIFHDALEAAGYDSMKAPHSNTVGGDFFKSEDITSSDIVEYDAYILFNPEQVKHVNAEFFDEADVRLYYRNPTDEPRGYNGAAATAMIDGVVDKLDTTNTLKYFEALEDDGASPELINAMGSMIRQRNFTPVEEQAVRKVGAMGFLRSQSERFHRMGMDFMGNWYKDHFPDHHQTFARKYMPLHHMLRDLPDADGKVRAWLRSSTGGVKQKHPESYRRILSALRRGPESRQYAALGKKEKDVYDAISLEFRKEWGEMTSAGMDVGKIENYVPQIWNRQKIEKNRDGFIQGMKRYYADEQTELGNTEFTEVDAQTFAEKVYQSLTRESVDGVQIPESSKSPIRGSTKNAQAESLDFNRLIRLQGESMNEMEKFLEDDLEFMLVKYFEGTTRRTLQVKKFGLNSHGVDDYLHVMEKGTRGIAKLLSTSKVFTKNFRSVDTDGVTETALRSEVRMPFEGATQDAQKFSEELLAVYKEKGSPAARKMLDDIAPQKANNKANKTYQRRVDAIIGALEDHKGVRTMLENDQAKFVENAMRVARKDSLNDFGGKAGLRVSRTLRTINNVSLLGFTTLTSLGDLALPIIRSSSMKSWAKAVKELATDKDYKQALSEIGVAMENITHERMLNMYGAVDSKLSNAFFNATMLTPWTDMNRQIAAAVGHQSFIVNQKKALNSYKKGLPIEQQPRAYKTAYRYMKSFGLESYLKGQRNEGVSLTNRALLADDDNLRKAIIRFADESIFQPNANDTPIFAQTPLGALAFQLKSFPLMMTRMGGQVLDEAKQGNVKPLLYFLSLGPSFGMGALAIKDVVQMRGGEDEQSPELRVRNALKAAGYDEKIHGNENDFLGWYVEGMMQMGGIGLLGDIFHSAVTQADNGSYGQVRFLQTLGGPSLGLVTSGLSVFGGALDAATGATESNSKERTAWREAATRIPVVGGIRRAREGIVDALAGESTSDSGGSSGMKSGFSSSMKSAWNN